jgi:hypothetical protein
LRKKARVRYAFAASGVNSNRPSDFCAIHRFPDWQRLAHGMEFL